MIKVAANQSGHRHLAGVEYEELTKVSASQSGHCHHLAGAEYEE